MRVCDEELACIQRDRIYCQQKLRSLCMVHGEARPRLRGADGSVAKYEARIVALLERHAQWAGLTFPLVATSTVALFFAARAVPHCFISMPVVCIWSSAQARARTQD